MKRTGAPVMPEVANDALRKKLSDSGKSRAPLRNAVQIADQFGRIASERLCEATGAECILRVADTRVSTLAEATKSMEPMSLISFIDNRKGAFAGATTMPPGLVYRAVEAMTGAADISGATPEPRAATPIEAALAADFGRILVTSLETAILAQPAYSGMGRLRQGVATINPDAFIDVDPDLDVWELTLTIAFCPEDEERTATLFVAFSALDDYATQVESAKPTTPVAIDGESAWANAMVRAARKAEVRMVAVLHQRALNVEDIECLERGAIIPLPVEDRMHIDFRLDTPGGVATQPIIAEGVLGATDGRRAVKLAEPLDDSVLNLLAPYAS